MKEFKEIKFTVGESEIEHSLFIRKHLVREKIPEKPPNRTLFVASVPPYFTKQTLQKFFTDFGTVTAVFLHQTPNAKVPHTETSRYFKMEPPIEGYKVAYIVFKNSSALDKVFSKKIKLTISKDVCGSGISKWINEYNTAIPNVIDLEKEVNEYMKKFDQAEERKKQAEKRLAEDEEGWVKVTKKGRHPGVSRKESVNIKSEQKKQNKQLTNFYRFQIKETKMKNLVELRQKFEEDKKRISAMKASRRFLIKF